MWRDLGPGVSLGLDIAAEYVNSRSDLMVKVFLDHSLLSV
jgi:hypothetical protein